MTDTLDMVAPTIMFVNDSEGGHWEVTYAGMVRKHRQDWQAWTFYEMALAMYSAGLAVKSIIPADPGATGSDS